MALQHLRSSTADKRPTPAAMSDGQLALNTNLVSPGLFFKDSNGDSVKIGPVHVGTTAPNVTPGAGGQAGNSKGEQWLDTSSSRYVFKIWDGTAWRSEDGEFVNASGDTMTGALGIIAGTAAAPGVFFSGDTNTGIYSPGADQVAVSTGGVQRLTVDSAGKVSLSGDIEFSRTNPAAITVDSNGNLRLSADSAATAAASAINFNVDGLEAADFNSSGYLRFNKAAFAGAGVCTQQLDSVLNLGGGQNTINNGLNISLAGPDLVSNTGYLMRWNTNQLYQWDKTSDFHAWYTGTSDERLRIRSDGNIGIGGAGGATVTLYDQAPITGGTTAYGSFTQSAIQSDVTGTALGYATGLTTAAAAFTLSALHHFSAQQSTFGAGSTVTNQYGFVANTNLTGATNNYGFYGGITSATGRWNFYATGTAPNYFAGDVRTNTVVTTRQSPVSFSVSTTLTAASILDGLRVGTPAAGINYTLPTGTNMDAAFQDLQTNQSFEWSVINLAAAVHVITVVANTDHTVVGNMAVAAATSGRFLTRKTAANTFISYRIA